MKHQRHAQQIDRSDPAVARFIRECGMADNAVTIKLVGASQNDLQIQIERLMKTFGPMITMTAPRMGRFNEWIVMGTILG